MACHQHTQQSPQLPSGFTKSLQLWSYNHTTASSQQNSCRFYKILVVMVLQPLNSELTIELLQVLQIAFNTHTHTQVTFKTKSCIMLSQNIMYSKYNRDNAFYQLHSHSTRHQTIQVLTDSGTLVSKWGGKKESNFLPILQVFLPLNTFVHEILIVQIQ